MARAMADGDYSLRCFLLSWLVLMRVVDSTNSTTMTFFEGLNKQKKLDKITR